VTDPGGAARRRPRYPPNMGGSSGSGPTHVAAIAGWVAGCGFGQDSRAGKELQVWRKDRSSRKTWFDRIHCVLVRNSTVTVGWAFSSASRSWR